MDPQRIRDAVRIVELIDNEVYKNEEEADRLGPVIDAARERYRQLRGPMSFDKASLIAKSEALARWLGLSGPEAGGRDTYVIAKGGSLKATYAGGYVGPASADVAVYPTRRSAELDLGGGGETVFESRVFCLDMREPNMPDVEAVD